MCFNGIQGRSVLLDIEYLDPTVALPPEYMHSQLLGTVKLLLDAWSKDWKSYFFDSSWKSMINISLNKIKFPRRALRKMPNFDQNKWTAMDYEVFLLYGFITLEGILKDVYFKNFQKLVYIISILTMKSIEKDVLNQVEVMIGSFISDFKLHYPTKMHRFNVHCLVHLVDVVRQFGPLGLSSSFFVENSMGKLASTVKSSNLVQQQVFNKTVVAFSVFASIQFEQEKSFDIAPSEVKLKSPLKKEDCLNGITPETRRLISTFVSLNDANFYGKVESPRWIVTTSKNDHMKKSENYFIKANNTFYRVVHIVANAQGQEVFLVCFKFDILKLYEPRETNVQLNYIFECTPTETIQVVKLSEVASVVAAFFLNRRQYFLEMFNKHL